MPRVCIGVPVYNGERFLRATLDSMLGQTLQEYEVIISDNASTDGTEKICREYVARDARIRYVKNEVNLGIAGNYNRVFELSWAPYFKWANADDVLGPEFLESCVEVLDRHPQVVLCYGKTLLIDESGSSLGPYEDGLDLRSPNPTERFLLVIERLRLVNVLQGVFRREVLGKTGLLGKYPGSDEVLVAELALHGQFCEIPKRMFFRRMHGQASSSLTTVESQQHYMDPSSKGKIFMRAWRHCSEHLRAICRAPITRAEKVRLVYKVGRLAVGDRGTLIREVRDAAATILKRGSGGLRTGRRQIV
jgi:hypothetical protein